MSNKNNFNCQSRFICAILAIKWNSYYSAIYCQFIVPIFLILKNDKRIIYIHIANFVSIEAIELTPDPDKWETDILLVLHNMQ